MNKQELIKHFEEMEYVSIHQMGKQSFIDLIEQLDEPQKPIVPQFVAGWMNYCKLTGVDLYHAFEMSDLYLENYAYQKDYPKLKGYFESENNQEIFARAWLDGYTVEKEKRYRVKMKKVGDISFLNHDLQSDSWLINDGDNGEIFKTHHTRKELEEAGFGWVFDCDGMEVKEVQDDTKI